MKTRRGWVLDILVFGNSIVAVIELCKVLLVSMDSVRSRTTCFIFMLVLVIMTSHF